MPLCQTIDFLVTNHLGSPVILDMKNYGVSITPKLQSLTKSFSLFLWAIYLYRLEQLNRAWRFWVKRIGDDIQQKAKTVIASLDCQVKPVPQIEVFISFK